jgi:hypothetical protein
MSLFFLYLKVLTKCRVIFSVSCMKRLPGFSIFEKYRTIYIIFLFRYRYTPAFDYMV